MSQRPAVPRRTFKPGLAARLVIVLSIAMLPLGLISVYQTYKVLEERRFLSKTALLEQTQQAVSDSREVIRSALSTAESLAVIVKAFPPDGGACSAVMDEIVLDSPEFVFAGYVEETRGLVCSSTGASIATPIPETARSDLLRREAEVLTRPLEFLGGVTTVSVTVPVEENGRFLGTMWVAVPIAALNSALSEAAPDVDLALFQQEGEILATEDFTDNRRLMLPTERSLRDLATQGRQTFRDTNREGLVRDFAVAPIVEDRVFVLGSWQPRIRGVALPGLHGAFALYFPLAMWAIAIGVAYVGIHRLVIRHVRRLRTWMRLYAAGRINLDNARLDNAPEELEVVAEAFRAMTHRLSEQDSRREEDLQEKTVLLREVHHRVKNNLQLISSIMNMQIRSTDSTEAKHLLRRVQDRVMALSAIHRYLYLARKLSTLRADKLLEEIIQQLVVVGTLDEIGHQIEVSTELDPVEISPDQSVPLSLLATEAGMNAVKYCGPPEGEAPWINIALKRLDDNRLCLSVVNSRGPGDETDEAESGTYGSGLGSRLIQSFVTQLNGTLEVQKLPERFELHVIFPLAWHKEEDEEAPVDGP